MSNGKPATARHGEEFLQKFHKDGLGYEACVKAYSDDEVVKIYHGTCEVVKYECPGILANTMAGLIQDKPKAKILDLAAGTGLIGKALYNLGFRDIDAHDGAAAMVDFCRTTGHYTDFYTCFVGDDNPLPMPDNTYDGMTCSGATVANHLPPSAQVEIARVIKPGGFFVNAYRGNLYETEVEYGNKWRAEAERLEREGTWELYGVLNFKKYNKASSGRMDIYQIL